MSVEPAFKPEVPDTRSPLERFRTKPKKALSVTDLISPSWCELQYWYTLTIHGKKKRTPAMRQGSAVHKVLEDQVFPVTINVDIQSKEDGWGLRIWNIIQGLKTLQETGMTRELEIWGIIDGQVVNGIIDELSYICPDRELEEKVTARTAHFEARKDILAADQTSITDFLSPTRSQNEVGVLRNLQSMLKKTSKVYVTDVKTRGVRTIPKGVAFRPTLLQLMLYHHLLSDMATNKVDAGILFGRYELNAAAQFSDSFIAQIGSLNEVFYEAASDPSQSQEAKNSSQDSMQLLLEHNSLHQLWGLMVREFRHTMPAGINSIGNVLKAEYRDQKDGSVLGIKTFLYDRDVMQTYLDNEMSWWKGKREAHGVNIEEAYKCRICEFAEGCSWRKTKTDEATQEFRRMRSRSVV